MIEGTQYVRLTIVFVMPPGLTPEVFQQALAQGGVAVGVGLLPYVRSSRYDVIEGPEGGAAPLTLDK